MTSDVIGRDLLATTALASLVCLPTHPSSSYPRIPSLPRLPTFSRLSYSSLDRSMTSTPASPTVTYLRSLGAVRDRSREVFDLIVAGKADHWDWHEDKLQTVVDFCAGLLTVR